MSTTPATTPRDRSGAEKLVQARSAINEHAHAVAGLGVLLWAVFIALWCAAAWLTIKAESIWLKVLFGTLQGGATGTLFVIGHDACHGSLTSVRALNRFFAWTAFLPSAHPPIAWDWGHNQLHHGWTNLRGKDDGYPPITLHDWQEMSATQRAFRRWIHTPIGIGFSYMVNVWWASLFRIAHDRTPPERYRLRFEIQRLSIVGFFLAHGLIAAALHENAVIAVLSCVVWPFLVWNWVMAFVTIQHHTHPQVKWFDDQTQWNAFQAQVGGTVHIKLPYIIELLFSNIFEHTAHHVHKTIPLYHLREAQRTLEQDYAQTVIVQTWSWAHFTRVLRECQLYDYQTHTWGRFPT